MEVVGHGVGVDLADAAFLGAQTACEVAEVVHRQRQVGGETFADRLAVVPGLGNGEHRQVLLQRVGDLEQDVRALGGRRLSPLGRRGMGGVERRVDVLCGSPGDLGERLAVHRRDVLEVLSLDRLDPLAADEVAVPALDGDERVR